MLISAPISVGELLDKISVLDIKHDTLVHQPELLTSKSIAKQLDNVRSERYKLLLLAEEQKTNLFAGELGGLFGELTEVNRIIWDAVDKIHRADSGWIKNPFKIARLARIIYKENDRRAEIKRKINNLTDSEVVEEKIYG